MLRILKPKLVGGIQGPIPPPAVASYTLDEINGIIRLLHYPGYVAGVFDAKKMMECEQDQVTHAYRSLYEKLIPLTGKCDPTDQADTAIADDPRGYLTGLSQYVSAESEIESDDLIGIQLMSRGPSGAANLRDRVETIKIEPRSITVRAKEEMISTKQGNL